MVDINKIRDYKLCRKPIKTLNGELKNVKKDQLILYIGKTKENFVMFLNSGIFIPTNFKNYYIEKLLVSNNKKIRKIINQQNYYKELNDKVSFNLLCRNQISAYKNMNLIYDLSPQLSINSESSKKSYLLKMREFFDVIFTKMNEFSYKEKIIVLDVDGMSKTDKESYLYYFQTAIKKKSDFFLDYFQDYKFLIVSSEMKTYFKFKVTEEIFNKKQMMNLRIDALLKEGSYEELIQNDELSTEETFFNNSSSAFSSKISKKEIIEEKKENKKADVKEKLKEVGVDLDKNEDNEDITEVDKTIDNALTQTIKHGDNEDMTEEELMNILLNKNEFKQSLIQSQKDELDGKRKQNDEQLRIQQEKLSFKDVSFKDIKENYEEKKIEKEEISHGNIKDVVNKEILNSTLKNYDDSYMKKKFNKDIVKVLKSFNNDDDIGVYIKDVKLSSNNTDMNKQSLLEVDFKDDTNVIHKFKINIPEIKDGKYMYVNGNKKVIMKQIVFLPIVKLEPDRVQITTNYNKHFVTRFGQKFSEKLDYLKRLFTKHNLMNYKKQGSTFSYKYGNSLKNNGNFITTSEYNDISSYLYSLNVENYIFIFDQTFITDSLNPVKSNYDEKLSLKSKFDKKVYFMIGYTKDKSKLILSNIKDRLIYLFDGKNYESLNISLSSFLISLIYNNTNEKVKGLTSSKAKTNTKLTYSRIEINNKKVPLVILLSYELGLLNLLDRYHIEYNFDTRSRSIDLQDDIGKIKFKDGYLYFDSSKIRNTILLSGLLEMDCEEINFSDMNEQEPYLDYFQAAFNSRNAAKGFHNTMTLLIDPITKEVLEELNQPTNVYDVLLYANTLLEDISFTEPSDVNNFRIRGAEQIPAMLYKVYADAFKHYKDSKHAKNPVKITVDPDILTKKLMELKTIENYSTLNPSMEAEKIGAASMRGLAGINVSLLLRKPQK